MDLIEQVLTYGVVRLCSFGTGDHVNNLHQSSVEDTGRPRRICTDLVVPVVPDVNFVAHVSLQDLIPFLFRDKSGCVHGATVADDQAVALASLS